MTRASSPAGEHEPKTDPHHALLTLAGSVPDGWLAVARDALAAGDTDRLAELRAALEEVAPPTHRARYRFTPHGAGYEDADRAVVSAVTAEGAAVACWAVMRDGSDRVYLVQADGPDLPAVTALAQDAIDEAGDTPRVEVFGPETPLPRYHEEALLAATLLWAATPGTPVRIARAFDGASPGRGPWFGPRHQLVEDAGERQRLLDFLSGGEVVLTSEVRLTDLITGTAGAVPADLRSDGVWVWSEASRYYLDRHRLAVDARLAAHARKRAPVRRLSPLDRYRVRAALVPSGDEDSLWRAG
ncbi:hypothetical protein [Amycolatopsis pigmentata]|uniref:Uncharacterized protein n=1 Tax=Amycolatopsis pigmentata TaxID=450801 RepID=A0ABW5G1K2_9PSEU